MKKTSATLGLVFAAGAAVASQDWSSHYDYSAIENTDFYLAQRFTTNHPNAIIGVELKCEVDNESGRDAVMHLNFHLSSDHLHRIPDTGRPDISIRIDSGSKFFDTGYFHGEDIAYLTASSAGKFYDPALRDVIQGMVDGETLHVMIEVGRFYAINEVDLYGFTRAGSNVLRKCGIPNPKRIHMAPLWSA